MDVQKSIGMRGCFWGGKLGLFKNKKKLECYPKKKSSKRESKKMMFKIALGLGS